MTVIRMEDLNPAKLAYPYVQISPLGPLFVLFRGLWAAEIGAVMALFVLMIKI